MLFKGIKIKIIHPHQFNTLIFIKFNRISNFLSIDGGIQGSQVNFLKINKTVEEGLALGYTVKPVLCDSKATVKYGHIRQMVL